MSQYSYGGYPGQPPHPPPPPPNPYAYQTYPAPPSVYGGSYDPNTVPPPAENYYAMNQNAYSYNQQSMPPSTPGIPGLGIAGPLASGSPYHPPPPAASPWGQPAYQPQPPTFAAGAPGAPFQYPVSQAPPQHYVPPPQPGPQPTQTKLQTVQHPASVPPNPALARNVVPNANNMPTQVTEDMEEGELSEGQFEDLYEPLPPVVQSKNTPPVAPTRPVADRSLPSSAGDSAADTPDAGFYTEDDGDGRGRSEPAKLANGQRPSRDKSGSYSPYLSPREIQGDNTPKDTARSPRTQPKSSAPSLPGFHIQPRSQVRVPGIGDQQKNVSHGLNEASGVKSSLSQSQTANGTTSTGTKSSFNSLADAKKEAQKAILRLWPMGVKYQHYIDEGIDEKVVKQLFSDLHLDMSTGKPAQPAAAQPAQPTKAKEAQKPAATPTSGTEKQQVMAPQIGTKPVAGDKADQTESRKDRIARLLAEKKAKGSATVSAPTAAPVVAPVVAAVVPPTSAPPSAAVSDLISAPVSVAAAPAVPNAPAAVKSPLHAKPAEAPGVLGTKTPVGGKPVKTKEEKERLLRQKMEELQRARAQKAGAGKAASSSAQASVSGPVTPLQPAAIGIPEPQPQAGAVAPGSVHAISSVTAVPTGPRGVRSSLPPGVPTGPRGSVTPTASAATPTSVQLRPSPGQQPENDAGPIPGLFLSSIPPASAPGNQRKRPVAADFVAYEAPAPKRPFGQERQDSSLVIDVSDGSDDDVEMDLESNPDAPLPLPRTNSTVPMGTSFGNFPPLTDTVRRQNASPALSAQTTPASLGKKEQEMLAAKERAIQEMKRKIAEAEAKAKLKAKQASSGPQTPNPTSATPSETNVSVSANHRGSSVSVIGKIDAPSAQLMSEAVAAKAPETAETPRTITQQSTQPLAELVTRNSVETDKERKKREKAERMRKLQEEMARLAAEDDDEEEDGEENQTQEVPRPAREASAEKLVSETQPSGNAPGESLSAASKEQHQDEVDVAKLIEIAADGPKALDEPVIDLGDHPELNEVNEEGEIDETEDVSMIDALQPIAESEESPEQTDVEMEGTGDGIPAAVPQPSNASDAGNSEQPLHGGDSTGLFLCPVEGCIKNTKGFTKQKFLKTHIRRKHKDVHLSSKAKKASQPRHQAAAAAPASPAAGIETQAALEEVEDVAMTAEPSASSPDVDGSSKEETQSGSRERSASYEPPEASVPAAEQIAVPSPQSTPAAVDSPLPSSLGGSTSDQSKLGQISDVSRARDKTQEIETMTMREARSPAVPASKARFTPYESPLRYFRAYRFHPEYNQTVSGGLKSLTYSNRIDPRRELCPTELQGERCSVDHCPFQHFDQLNAGDDQVLLELGRADDYTGEQKARFIQGLRELLQSFRTDKVKDFERIAHGIIEYRHKFLGDQSKILPLEGVSL